MTLPYRDLDRFHRFVDSITTPSGVGGDTAEDVFGGLDAVLKLSWPREGTKVSTQYIARYKQCSAHAGRWWSAQPSLNLLLPPLLKEKLHESVTLSSNISTCGHSI